MTAQSIAQRVARYAKLQRIRGIVQVTVYVPLENIDRIRDLAKELRLKKAFHTISKKGDTL